MKIKWCGKLKAWRICKVDSARRLVYLEIKDWRTNIAVEYELSFHSDQLVVRRRGRAREFVDIRLVIEGKRIGPKTIRHAIENNWNSDWRKHPIYTETVADAFYIAKRKIIQ